MLATRDNLFDELRTQGFASIPDLVSEAGTARLYETFDDVLTYCDEPNTKAERDRIDFHIEDFIRAQDNSVVDSTIKLSSIDPKFRNYKIQAYQYFRGLSPFLSTYSIPAFLESFWLQLETLASHCDHQLGSLLCLDWSRFLSIVKIWRYTPVLELDYLIPVHFDRSVFSVIVDTKNPGEERLVFGSNSHNGDIEKVARNFKASRQFRPARSDLPVIFPGLHAWSNYQLKPTPHAVEQIEGTSISSRYSVVYFIVPRNGVSVQQAYVARD